MTTLTNNNETNDNGLGPIKKGLLTGPLFKVFWFIAFTLLILNLNYVFQLGNVNWIERSFFLGAALFFVIKNPLANKVVVSGFVIIVLSIFLFSSLTGFAEFSWNRTINATLATVSIFMFLLAIPNQEERLYMLKTIAAVTPILVVTGFLYKLLIGRPMFAFDYNGIMRYGGGTIPAFLAAGAYSSSIAYSMMFRHSKKIIYLAFAFASLFACVLSGSRMPTVCATICIFTIIFASIKNGVLRIIFVFSGVVTITVGLLTVGGDLLARFSSGSSSGRDLIWKSVMIWADRYPWTGVGFGHQHLLISDYVQKLTHTRATHNEYVRLAGELGYIGSTFFIIGIFMMLYFAPVKKGISDTLVTLIVLGTFFLYSYSDNTMSAAYCMLAPIAYALGSGLTTETDQKTE